MLAKRAITTVIIAIALVLSQGIALSADLIQQVPLESSAYERMRQLVNVGLIPDSKDIARTASAQRPLTRYDFAFLLLEPFERLCAIIEAQENPTLSLEQRRRTELAYQSLSKLKSTEMIALLNDAENLRKTFSADIDQLSAGLSARAETAIVKLRLPSSRPWEQAGEAPSSKPDIRFFLDPHAQPNDFGTPLPGYKGPYSGTGPMPFISGGSTTKDPALLGTFPVTRFETAVDIAFGRFLLYGSLSSLPGDKPSLLVKPDEITGSAMVGIRVDLARMKNLDISGIFEYHVMRTNDPTTTNDTSDGYVGGIGIKW